MAYSELIKSFSRIRGYMRQFYVYGFKSRDEYDAKSARSYDNERRRIESWLGGYMDFRQDSGGRRVFISVDSRQASRNPLYRAFKAKSFTDRDIVLHFMILDLLAEGQPFTAREITEMIQCILPDESTVRKKLREYEDIGLVVSEKQGRELFYRRSEDSVCLEDWRDALDFFSESNLLGIVGSYLADRLDTGDDIFRFKHHYILQALESEILCTLLTAIADGRIVRFTAVPSSASPARSFEAIPLRIRASVQEGRYYAIVCAPQMDRFHPVRLDRIDSVEILDKVYDVSSLQDGLDEFCAHLWGASTGEYPATEHIEMILRYEDYEPHIPLRLEREKRCGRVEHIDRNTLRFCADVYDTQEMLPWLRTFTGRIMKLECSNPAVIERFTSDLEATAAMYGGETVAVQ